MEGWRVAWNKEKMTACQLGMVCPTCGGASISTCWCAMEKFRRQWENDNPEPKVTQKRVRSKVTFGDIYKRFAKCLLDDTGDHEALVQRIKSAQSLEDALYSLECLEEQLKSKQ